MLDPAAGILVALWIFRTTWRVGGQSLGYLTGRGASREIIREIVEKAQEVQDVEKAHRVIADYVGPRLRVEIHVSVDSRITLEHAHEIAEEVQARVESLPSVDLVFVHVDPYRKL
jgi:divalent metal cation (Fe/Co/Zn/Cd) transporter